MENKINYLTQYCNMKAEWKRNRITVDNAAKSQVQHIQDLQAKAIEQSGLSLSELFLICRCRNNNIFKRVNAYSRELI